MNYLSDAYPEHIASVFGAGFPLLAGAMYNKLGVNWASSTLGFISIAFIPVPSVLYKYGGWLRKKSKYARQDV